MEEYPDLTPGCPDASISTTYVHGKCVDRVPESNYSNSILLLLSPMPVQAHRLDLAASPPTWTRLADMNNRRNSFGVEAFEDGNGDRHQDLRLRRQLLERRPAQHGHRRGVRRGDRRLDRPGGGDHAGGGQHHVHQVRQTRMRARNETSRNKIVRN